MTLPPVHCIDCEHFDMRRYADMARVGYGTCGLDRRAGRFQSAVFDRTCVGFVAVKPDVAQLRRQWLADQQEKFHELIHGETT